MVIKETFFVENDDDDNDDDDNDDDVSDDEGAGVFCSTVRVMSPRSWLALLQS